MEKSSEFSHKDLLDKILASKEFSNSAVYGNYLTYLVNASLDEINLKETTIAIEFFEKDAEFNPASDTIVRSHTYNLRKKLEAYYYSEGREDKFRIRIPKGHYSVEIVQESQNVLSPVFLLDVIRKYYPFLITGILVMVIAFLWIRNTAMQKELDKFRIIKRDDPVWKNFLQSNLPILLIPGDHFIFNIYSEKFKRSFSIRDVTINSMEELDQLKRSFPDTSIAPENEPYFPYHSIWSLPPIFLTFFSNHQYPILRKSSSISPQMLNEYNIVFVGSIKTLYILKHTIARSHFEYSIAPHKIIYTSPDSATVKEYRTNLHSTGPNEDLVLALKLPGPVNNTIFLIASYHSLGAPDIASYLTTPERRIELENLFNKKYGHFPEYFEILFRVIGIDKTAYTTEILVANEIVNL